MAHGSTVVVTVVAACLTVVVFAVGSVCTLVEKEVDVGTGVVMMTLF